jgi:hypothetical protein
VRGQAPPASGGAGGGGPGPKARTAEDLSFEEVETYLQGQVRCGAVTPYGREMLFEGNNKWRVQGPLLTSLYNNAVALAVK